MAVSGGLTVLMMVFRYVHLIFQVRKADFNNDQYVQDFGISINEKMVELEGRVLQAPKLQYGGKVSKLVFLIPKLRWYKCSCRHCFCGNAKHLFCYSVALRRLERVFCQ